MKWLIISNNAERRGVSMKAKIAIMLSVIILLLVVFSANGYGESVQYNAGEKLTYINNYSGNINHGISSG